MTNNELENELKEFIKDERRITAYILELINVAAERRVYLDRGFETLFDWLTKGLGYSEPAARRRIGAAQLIKSVPKAREKIESGLVNLTTLARTQSAIRCHEKITGQPVSPETKADLLEKIERKSLTETELTLAAHLQGALSAIHQDKRLVVDENTFRVATNFSVESMADLDRVRELLSHALPIDANLGDVISYLAKEFLRRKDPLQKRKAQTEVAAVNRRVNGRRAVPAAVRRAVFQRDKGRCVFKDPRTGQVCGSRNRVELDHIVPVALGGDDSVENLRCLCSAHNKRVAELALGELWANSWRGS